MLPHSSLTAATARLSLIRSHHPFRSPSKYAISYTLCCNIRKTRPTLARQRRAERNDFQIACDLHRISIGRLCIRPACRFVSHHVTLSRPPPTREGKLSCSHWRNVISMGICQTSLDRDAPRSRRGKTPCSEKSPIVILKKPTSSVA